MSDSRRREAEELFQRAADLPRGERTAFVRERCGANDELRREVEGLLTCHEKGKIESLQAVEIDEAPGADLVGETVGPYAIVELLGEGGFGAVYRAEQEEPIRRTVALKVIKLGMDSKQILARFEAERQALAMMNHPSIARVFDAGTTETGRPYFAMELVRGVPITEYCDEKSLTTSERIALFFKVCHAVQHAHQKGIIHRDIKPSNVLVTIHDAEPVPKVIDFGIAKATKEPLTKKTLSTGEYQFIGTPEYMSPEQAESGQIDIDTRSDIYSLGVLLYVLLTGRSPFGRTTLRRVAYWEVQRIIREEDPPTPSQRLSRLGKELKGIAQSRRVSPTVLRRLIKGDLDWIVMKALEKDRDRRYQTASSLAADLQRHLRNQPVLASPPSAAYRLRKFIRRNKVPVTAGGLMAAALILGFSFALFGFFQATEARDELRIERDAAERARIDAETARAGEERERRRAVDNEKKARNEANRCAAVSAFLQEMLASVDPENALGREPTMRFVLDEAAARIEEGSLHEDSGAEAAVRMTIGKTYKALGLFGLAAVHLRKAETIWHRSLGGEAPETLRARSALADLYCREGKYSLAETILRQTFETESAVLGEEHADTLVTMNRLGVSLWRQDKHEEAEALHRRALAIQRRVFGNEHLSTLRSMTNLGTTLLGQKRLDDAEEILSHTLEVDRRVLGDIHPDTQKAMNNLALVYERSGDLARAERLFRQALEMDRRVLGIDHPSTQIPLLNLIRVLAMQGRREEARSFVKEQIAVRQRAASEDDAGAKALNDYAWILLTCEFVDLCDTAAALPVAKRAALVDGGHDPNIWDTLSLAYETNNDLSKAIESQRMAVVLLAKGGSSLRFEIEGRLLDLLWKEKGFEKIEKLVKTTVDEKIAAVWSKEGRFSNEEFTPGILMAVLGESLKTRKRFAEAEVLLEECLAIREKILPGDHWLIGETMGLLGEALACEARFDAAEQRLLDGAALVERSADAPPKCKRLARERLVALYEAWQKPAEAERWRETIRGESKR